MQSFKLFITVLFVGLVVLTGCSSDIFNPPKDPIIKELILSAYEVNPGDTVAVSVDVEDEKDAVLSYKWEVSGGRLIPPTDGPTVSWIMPVAGGDYTIKVKVSNQDEKSSNKKVTATVRSFQDPVVRILSPAKEVFFVQSEQTCVEADASHENGISAVNLYVNDILQRTMTTLPSGHYSADLDLQNWVGETEIKVEAIARTTRTVGRDSINVYIEGLVLGK